ncbi:MAG: DUF2283 domain-containing protein [Candidatus Poribacteria bacterium]|nr:DUF2283 domain-containing protein [Candidatus Poribacteria bacterium]
MQIEASTYAIKIDMTQPIFNYDEASDTLYISYAPGEQATSIELTPHILLRLNKQDRRAIGMTFLEYSLLTQKTDMGPRSFPLTGLSELSNDLRDIVIDVLQRPPVSDVLLLSSYTPSISETIPIMLLQTLTN